MFHATLGHGIIRVVMYNLLLVLKTYHFVFFSISVHPVYSSSGGQETWALVAPPRSLVAGRKVCEIIVGRKATPN